MWKDLVNTGVLEIMSYLPYYDIVRAGQVCRRWKTLSLDDLLWKAVLTRHLKIPPPVTLRPGAPSWRREFIRIMDEVPSVLTDLPDHYVQKARLATHVSFAHTKEIFSVCYGEEGVAIWRSSHPCTRISVHGCIGWKTTSSKFNSSDTLLLVTGVKSNPWDDEVYGKVALYQAGGPAYPDQFSLVMVMDSGCSQPYNGWITDTTFLTDEGADRSNLKVCGKSVDPFNDSTEMLYNVHHDNMLSGSSGIQCSIIDAHDGTPGLVVQIGNQELHVPQGPQHDDMYYGDRPWHMAPTRIGILDKNHANELKIFTPTNENFEHMLIAGFCPSPDQKICYISTRPLTRNHNVNSDMFPMAFISNENLQILPLNLSTMMVGPPLTGHKGIAHDNIDWTETNDLFPDVTSFYVGCGSDDGCAYLWDRHYGCLVSVLSGSLACPTNNRKEDYSVMDDEECTMSKDEHEELTDRDEEETVAGGEKEKCIVTEGKEQSESEDKESDEKRKVKEPIICVAVDPKRQNVMVTVGKNGQIKVFRSKKWIRENGFQ